MANLHIKILDYQSGRKKFYSDGPRLREMAMLNLLLKADGPSYSREFLGKPIISHPHSEVHDP